MPNPLWLFSNWGWNHLPLGSGISWTVDAWTVFGKPWTIHKETLDVFWKRWTVFWTLISNSVKFGLGPHITDLTTEVQNMVQLFQKMSRFSLWMVQGFPNTVQASTVQLKHNFLQNSKKLFPLLSTALAKMERKSRFSEFCIENWQILGPKLNFSVQILWLQMTQFSF